MHISSVVSSPQLDLDRRLARVAEVAGELSKWATISTLVPLGRATGVRNS